MSDIFLFLRTIKLLHYVLDVFQRAAPKIFINIKMIKTARAILSTFVLII